MLRNPLHAWHLLSLDAPTVAVLWTAFAAHLDRTPLAPVTYPAMFLFVWILYAADRLLGKHDTQPRHLFHRRHALAFRLGIVASVATLAALLPLFPRKEIALYAALALPVAAWLLLVHLTRLRLPKELVTALLFAAAVFLPELALPALRHPNPRPLLDAALFATLGLANGRLISTWEAAPPNPWPARLTTLLAASTLAFTLSLPRPAVPLAVCLAACLLLALHLARRYLRPTTLRAAADAALLTPILVWPFLP